MATSEIPKLLVLVSLACALATGCDKSGTKSPGGGGGSYADLGITLTSLDDEDITVASETAADVHVLAFWATWCIPCVGELAQMQGVYDRLASRGLKIYAISIDGPDTMSRVPGFASQEKWTFPVMYDPDTQVLARFNPKGDIPFYVVLDADGNILKSHQGYVKGDMVELEKFLNEKLPAAAGAAAAE
ncbi:peroxiredoxin family protein [Nannocystaceae bacterium ST9]